MKNLFIKGSEETPEIVFDQVKPEFRVSGKSYMEDATAHYEKVISWLKSYSKNPNPSTTFKFELEYVNTASSKIVNDILDELEKIFLAGHTVSVEWYYYEDDEDMLELGQEYEEVYKVPFKFEIMEYGNERSTHMFED